MDNLEILGEEQLNRLLRRVDWRYLLANPKPKKSICFNDGILKQATGAISSSLISATQVKPGECDLAVAINPTTTVLQSAMNALCPDGEIYTEWYLPFVGGGNGVRKRLEQMGFTNVICYWSWPSPIFASPSYWLPLNSSKVFRYYVANRPASSSIVVQSGRLILQAILALSLQDRVLLPVCAIASKSVSGNSKGFQSDVNTEIIKQRKFWSFDKAPAELIWLLQTPGHRSISKIIASVFSEREEEPGLVVKISRSNISARALASEADNLTLLSSRKRSSVKGIPRLLFRLNWKGILTVGEAFVVGEPIYTHLDHDNYRDIALKVTDWLIGLADGSTLSPRSAWWDRLVGPVVRDFTQSFGAVFTSQELSWIHDIMNNLGTMPIVFEQRDCSPWNILINQRNEVTVLDWESAEANGLPALDLIYFLTYLSFFLEGAMKSGRYLEAYRNASNPASFTGKVQRECEEKYCAQTKIDLKTLRPLRLLTWLIHSGPEYQRLKEDTGGQPAPSALRAGLFSQLVREEIQLYL